MYKCKWRWKGVGDLNSQLREGELERRIWSVWGQNRWRNHCWESLAGPQPCVHSKETFLSTVQKRRATTVLADTTLKKRYWRGKSERELGAIVQIRKRKVDVKLLLCRTKIRIIDAKFPVVYWVIGLLVCCVIVVEKKKKEKKQKKNWTKLLDDILL